MFSKGVVACLLSARSPLPHIFVAVVLCHKNAVMLAHIPTIDGGLTMQAHKVKALKINSKERRSGAMGINFLPLRFK